MTSPPTENVKITNRFCQLYQKTYETPAIQIVEVKVEGIVCASDQNGTGEGFTWE